MKDSIRLPRFIKDWGHTVLRLREKGQERKAATAAAWHGDSNAMVQPPRGQPDSSPE